MTLPRSVARRWTRIARVLSLVALALAAGVILAPREAVRAPEPLTAADVAAGPETAPADAGASAGVSVFDWPALADSLALVRGPTASANEPVVAETPAPADPEPEPDSLRVAAGPAPPGWQYVGYARDPHGAYTALITLNGRQKFLRPGDRYEEFLVSSVEADRIILERDNRRFEVARVAPLAFDAERAAMNAQNRLRNPAARSRAAQLEQEQMRALEEARRRAAFEQGGSTPATPPPNQ